MGQPLIMSFRLDAVTLCLSGKKTETRRVIKNFWSFCRQRYQPANESYSTEMVYARSRSGRSRNVWSIGQHIGLKSSRTGPILGRVRINSLRVEKLLTITDQSAIAECVEPPTRDGYLNVWSKLNGKKGTRVDDNPFVLVIGFEPIK